MIELYPIELYPLSMTAFRDDAKAGRIQCICLPLDENWKAGTKFYLMAGSGRGIDLSSAIKTKLHTFEFHIQESHIVKSMQTLTKVS